MNYERRCPGCGVVMVYKTVVGHKGAEMNNTRCRLCSGVKKYTMKWITDRPFTYKELQALNPTVPAGTVRERIQKALVANFIESEKKNGPSKGAVYIPLIKKFPDIIPRACRGGPCPAMKSFAEIEQKVWEKIQSSEYYQDKKTYFYVPAECGGKVNRNKKRES